MSKLFTTFVFMLSVCFTQAQQVTYTAGGTAPFESVKETGYYNFTSNGLTYHITRVYVLTIPKYEIYCYDNAGGLKYHSTLDLNPGVFNNTYTVNALLPLNNKVIGMVEHLDKAAGKNTLSARVLDENGQLGKTDTELNFVPFEKILNSGFNFYSVAPSGNTFGVASELPFEKEQSAKIKYAWFDSDLKKLKSGTITIPGENTKNKQLRLIVGDDGTFYLSKQTTAKNGVMNIAVYQWKAGDASAKEYFVDVTAANLIRDYQLAINATNELLICGTWYENKTLTVGENVVHGIFCFKNTGTASAKTIVSTLDNPMDNLIIQDIHVNGSTIFVGAEQLKEERVAGASGALGDFNYIYKHGNNLVIGLDADGAKKFQIELTKSYSANNIDLMYHTGYAIVNNELTLVYNDDARKYIEGAVSGIVPILVQVSNDGLMRAPVVIKGKEFTNEYLVMYPALATGISQNKMSVLIGSSSSVRPIVVTVTK